MEMMEYGNSARGHPITLENEGAMDCHLKEIIQGPTMKQKAYGTLVSSEMHTAMVDQLVSVPWRAVEVRHFEEKMQTTPKMHALIAIPDVKTELLLRFAWCLTGLAMAENDSAERKWSKKEMTRCS